ncbi:MAG: hypothetical protein U5L11_13385 [Arhodomonas sp.]|nr:hypothetical protein [Arhodomonas sp.]
MEVKAAGTARLHNLKTVQHHSGNLVAVSRSGEITVMDEYGRERERYKVPYGATIARRRRRRRWRPVRSLPNGIRTRTPSSPR